MEKVIQEIAKAINTQYKKIIIGISGHGASGKTTFANKLIEHLDESDVNYLNTDPYIMGSKIRKYTTIDYEYQNENHQFKMTACHPAAHQIDALERDINMMREGLDFYSIETSYVESTLMSSQNKVNIVEGMSVAFIDPNIIDLNIYLYTDGETELLRRGIRDVSERGTDLQYLKQSHRQRRIQYEIFMHPYHQNFDVVIKNSNKGYHLEKNKL
ncbi:uridine kinase family protein [Aquisalibacillus elongatus]|uniref:Uridine kinase n=1 Tax=Aquisalibacillus elongatus TaxID=485577 RepID=A0A3N5BCB2_9BACI|nr:P-loop NTPase fold protein [Aquisalibacillus elongatus]RPF55254.1 uridine kinase [Aquisalibacillus elongatus]